jgi:RNA polymerase sigma-70 factor (ECF subfamily)
VRTCTVAEVRVNPIASCGQWEAVLEDVISIRSAARTDAALIAASAEDSAAFAGVFDRHWPRIHRYCVSRAGAAGEDIAAETFRVAFDQRDRFDLAQDDAAPWLYGIATNLVRHWLRGAARGRSAVSRLRRPFEGDHADDALDRVEARLLGPGLAAALRGLSAADRDALLLHAWAELSYEEIARATNVPLGTVRSRIHRARRRVRAHLDPGGDR